MFVPGGCISIPDVVDQIALDIDVAAMSAQKPEAVLRAERANLLRPDFDASYRPPPASSPEAVTIEDWKPIEAKQVEARNVARQQLQQSLGNGILLVIALLPDGSIVRTSPQGWRTNEGSRALKTGYAMTGGLVIGNDTFDPVQSCPLFVPEVEFRKWREGPPDPGVVPAVMQDACLSREVAPHHGPSTRRRNAGGRPQRADWQLFDQQTVRHVAVNKGSLTRTELRKQMKHWAATNMPDPPDDRTIERRLDYLVPDDALVED
jgi:hypothetical protein